MWFVIFEYSTNTSAADVILCHKRCGYIMVQPLSKTKTALKSRNLETNFKDVVIILVQIKFVLPPVIPADITIESQSIWNVCLE